jgi:hypothetical protein
MPTTSGKLMDQEQEYRQKCKITAIQIARDLKPALPPSGSLGHIGGNTYDILLQAQKIYEWLIADL